MFQFIFIWVDVGERERERERERVFDLYLFQPMCIRCVLERERGILCVLYMFHSMSQWVDARRNVLCVCFGERVKECVHTWDGCLALLNVVDCFT